MLDEIADVWTQHLEEQAGVETTRTCVQHLSDVPGHHLARLWLTKKGIKRSLRCQYANEK